MKQLKEKKIAKSVTPRLHRRTQNDLKACWLSKYIPMTANGFGWDRTARVIPQTKDGKTGYNSGYQIGLKNCVIRSRAELQKHSKEYVDGYYKGVLMGLGMRFNQGYDIDPDIEGFIFPDTASVPEKKESSTIENLDNIHFPVVELNEFQKKPGQSVNNLPSNSSSFPKSHLDNLNNYFYVNENGQLAHKGVFDLSETAHRGYHTGYQAIITLSSIKSKEQLRGFGEEYIYGYQMGVMAGAVSLSHKNSNVSNGIGTILSKASSIKATTSQNETFNSNELYQPPLNNDVPGIGNETTLFDLVPLDEKDSLNALDNILGIKEASQNDTELPSLPSKDNSLSNSGFFAKSALQKFNRPGASSSNDEKTFHSSLN